MQPAQRWAANDTFDCYTTHRESQPFRDREPPVNVDELYLWEALKATP